MDQARNSGDWQAIDGETATRQSNDKLPAISGYFNRFAVGRDKADRGGSVWTV